MASSSAHIDKKLEEIQRTYDQACQSLLHEKQASRLQEISKECARLKPIVDSAQKLQALKEQLHDAIKLTKDIEMQDMAKKEVDELQDQIAKEEKELKLLFLPKDENDERNIVLEVRAGTGGDEAALFAGDLVRMYERYALTKGWRFDVISVAEAELGGIKELVATIEGRNVFERLKHESGVHRVQRIPLTESNGRIHTSAATVAVLPEAREIDININEGDLQVDVFRASGAGGQHVNKTESAVRMTHKPTGIVVVQQNERSQHKNRLKALTIIKTKVYDLISSQRAQERSSQRKDQVGSGDRSQRIRTYNFPQSRVSDHRINLTLHNLEDLLNGTGLDALIDALLVHEQAEKLAHLDW